MLNILWLLVPAAVIFGAEVFAIHLLSAGCERIERGE